MRPVRLILVGGFLGAGKTTLLGQAAEHLARQDKRVGLVTNDQAANLVDTAVLQGAGDEVREVAGGCFCCRFPDLITATEELVSEFNPDVLICEPVGSCTDLSATVIQPIKKMHGNQLDVTPYSVLVDPTRTVESLSEQAKSGFPQNVVYIFRKQLEEADVVVLNRADVTSSSELVEAESLIQRHFPSKPVLRMSALRGDGVGAWLECLSEKGPSGQHIAEVDYDEYAAGEAALGWLNAAVRLHADGDIDWSRFCLEFLEALQRELQNLSAEAAHVKLHLTAAERALTANLTNNQGTPSIQGASGVTARDAALLVNARAHIGPDRLRTVVEQCMESVAGNSVRVSFDDVQSFAPARPQPTHRFDSVVEVPEP